RDHPRDPAARSVFGAGAAGARPRRCRRADARGRGSDARRAQGSGRAAHSPPGRGPLRSGPVRHREGLRPPALRATPGTPIVPRMPLVAAIQMTSGPDVLANLQDAGALLEEAAGRGAQLATLPENFSFMGLSDRDKRRVAEDDGRGPVQDFLAETARRLQIWVVAGTVP